MLKGNCPRLVMLAAVHIDFDNPNDFANVDVVFPTSRNVSVISYSGLYTLFASCHADSCVVEWFGQAL